MAQAEADGHLTGTAQLQRTGAGGLDVGAAVFVDAGGDLRRAVLPVGIYQSLDQQPDSGGGLDVGDRHLTGIDRIGQVLQTGGSGQPLGLHQLGV